MIDPRIQKIHELFTNFSFGKFDSQIEVSPESDGVDAFIIGLQMLGEELKSTTISRNYFNDIFNSVSDMIFVLNSDGIINNINDSVKQLFSCSKNELINSSIETLFSSSQSKLFKDAAAKLQNDSCKTVSSAIKMQYYNTNIDTQCEFTHFHLEQNEKNGFLLIARDVRKMKESEAKYQKIFQDSSDVIFIMDKDYQFIEVNKAGKQLLNLKNGIPTILDLFSEASEKTDFEKVLKENKSVKDFYAKLKSNQNKKLDCLISVNRIEEYSGNLQGVIKDITVQKANEIIIINTIIQTEENERKRIAADLHDSLGQQLSAILFYLGTVKGNKNLSPDVSELLEKSHHAISNSVQELRNICFNIMPRTLEDYDLFEATKELCSKIEKQEILKFDLLFPKTKVTLPKSLEITLFRIIQEFINNTIKHANAKEVKIKFTLQKNCLSIDISDNGIGFEIQQQFTKTGMGLKNMESRLLPFNGKLLLSSTINKGTLCRIKIDKQYFK